mgnify:CR=1 FL=1
MLFRLHHKLEKIALERYIAPEKPSLVGLSRAKELILTGRRLTAEQARARGLVAEVVHGAPTRFEDPARFSFAHGGKDGTPFPVDRATYDRTVSTLHRAMAGARVDRSERIDALKRLFHLKD